MLYSSKRKACLFIIIKGNVRLNVIGYLLVLWEATLCNRNQPRAHKTSFIWALGFARSPSPLLAKPTFWAPKNGLKKYLYPHTIFRIGLIKLVRTTKKEIGIGLATLFLKTTVKNPPIIFVSQTSDSKCWCTLKLSKNFLKKIAIPMNISIQNSCNSNTHLLGKQMLIQASPTFIILLEFDFSVFFFYSIYMKLI